jgi:hypothetical protein
MLIDMKLSLSQRIFEPPLSQKNLILVTFLDMIEWAKKASQATVPLKMYSYVYIPIS